MLFRAFLTPAQHDDAEANGWRVTLNLRVDDALTPSEWDAGIVEPVYFDMAFSDIGTLGDRRWRLRFSEDPATGNAVVQVQDDGQTVMTDSDGYHEYVLQWDPATEEATLTIDGAIALTGLNGSGAGSWAADGRLDWGLSSSPGTGQGYFNHVKLEVASLEPMSGDLNGDGFVGGDDLDIVRSFWGQDVTEGDLLSGDPSGDGFVGGDDLDIVRANWGDGMPPAPVDVPEPITRALVAAGLIVIAVPCRALRRR